MAHHQEHRRRVLTIVTGALAAGLIFFASTTKISPLFQRGRDAAPTNIRRRLSTDEHILIHHGTKPKKTKPISAHIDEKHAIKCCSKEEVGPLWQKSPYGKERCPFAYVMSEPECKHYTFHEANVFCGSVGGRLCTLEELDGLCAAGSGCGFDLEHVWTFLGNLEDVEPQLMDVANAMIHNAMMETERLENPPEESNQHTFSSMIGFFYVALVAGCMILPRVL
mmetsp:Transcript_13186/g.22592  ORF Transcript_13186/g.22592 Transcript_13186/m.22592 type:complete len:223 (-) Transcript_13186:830-1498(-)|eukprot:CAMPEP_0183734722 /NCGR_PEP_ID=MMETSP0737-20130205/44645_1 /TAXON_ID=385413 /ORGANISM="Thalassiosira miniscula, Strain CCMP1093" /LENGTH=222 /DNA_ID=CAMNT_0025968293 /DNA_START=35 /DNA_END=703 /DNA_ORIENTATION=+